MESQQSEREETLRRGHPALRELVQRGRKSNLVLVVARPRPGCLQGHSRRRGTVDLGRQGSVERTAGIVRQCLHIAHMQHTGCNTQLQSVVVCETPVQTADTKGFLENKDEDASGSRRAC